MSNLPLITKCNSLKNKRFFLLSGLSGILLLLSWPDFLFAGLIFIAWVPLLLVAKEVTNKKDFFQCCLFTTLIWNTGTTWWIWNSTAAGAIGAIVANSFLMCIPLWGFITFYKKFGAIKGYVSLIVFWLCFEYIHLNWQLSWPWLTLGNVFAEHPNWIQWYEYTGVGGGSLWVLLTNVMLFHVTQLENNKKIIKGMLVTISIFSIPLLLSFGILSVDSKTKTGQNNNVVIVQPNIDPYTEKFDIGSADRQLQKLVQISEKYIDTNTRLVLWPETAMPVGEWQDKVKESLIYKPVFDFARRHPNSTIQSGIETYKNYGPNRATSTARRVEGGANYYDAFNASITIKQNEPLQFYDKSKLVPGVETLPDFLLWMGDIFEKFGGTTGGYGHDKEATAFRVNGTPYVTAPIICYESIYGEYITTYVTKGANLLTIMTNDGWWANTAGHRQHLQYARMRAIETRKWVARSANTGISAVIDDYGSIKESLSWNETGAIKYAIPVIQGETFYVLHGDLIFRMALWLTIAFLIFYVYFLINTRIKK